MSNFDPDRDGIYTNVKGDGTNLKEHLEEMRQKLGEDCVNAVQSSKDLLSDHMNNVLRATDRGEDVEASIAEDMEAEKELAKEIAEDATHDYLRGGTLLDNIVLEKIREDSTLDDDIEELLAELDCESIEDEVVDSVQSTLDGDPIIKDENKVRCDGSVEDLAKYLVETKRYLEITYNDIKTYEELIADESLNIRMEEDFPGTQDDFVETILKAIRRVERGELNDKIDNMIPLFKPDDDVDDGVLDPAYIRVPGITDDTLKTNADKLKGLPQQGYKLTLDDYDDDEAIPVGAGFLRSIIDNDIKHRDEMNSLQIELDKFEKPKLPSIRITTLDAAIRYIEKETQNRKLMFGKRPDVFGNITSHLEEYYDKDNISETTTPSVKPMGSIVPVGEAFARMYRPIRTFVDFGDITERLDDLHKCLSGYHERDKPVGYLVFSDSSTNDCMLYITPVEITDRGVFTQDWDIKWDVKLLSTNALCASYCGDPTDFQIGETITLSDLYVEQTEHNAFANVTTYDLCMDSMKDVFTDYIKPEGDVVEDVVDECEDDNLFDD